MNPLLRWVAALAVAATVAGCSPQQPPQGSPADPATGDPPPPADQCRDAPTGPDEVVYARRDGTDVALTSLDVHLPAGCGPVPVVVWIHGGGWARGDKDGAGVDAKVALAHRLGAALLSVNYRLSGPDSPVVWPDHGDDIAAALGWVTSEGPRWGLDASSLVVMGHSAGAHLALMAVVGPDQVAAAGPAAGAVRCVVALDTAAFDLADGTLVSGQLVSAAFGDDPRQRAEASPLVAVGRHGAPGAELLVVTRGPSRRVAAASQFVDAVVAAGGSASLVVVDASHNQVNALLGADGDTVVTPVVEPTLQRCLSGAAG